jgi:hypothetical protein
MANALWGTAEDTGRTLLVVHRDLLPAGASLPEDEIATTAASSSHPSREICLFSVGGFQPLREQLEQLNFKVAGPMLKATCLAVDEWRTQRDEAVDECFDARREQSLRNFEELWDGERATQDEYQNACRQALIQLGAFRRWMAQHHRTREDWIQFADAVMEQDSGIVPDSASHVTAWLTSLSHVWRQLRTGWQAPAVSGARLARELRELANDIERRG